MTGFFITFEGIEGVGKTTQVQKAFDLLSAKHPGNVIITREPGGTQIGETIRNIILQGDADRIDGITEMLLLFAARRQHIQDLIQPSLDAGRILLCDRFTDATFAYQGGGRSVDERLIAWMQDTVQEGLRPDLTLLLDAAPDVGLARIRERSAPDRFEMETMKFFQRVRHKYLDLARRHSERIHVINAAGEADEIAREIQSLLAVKGLC